MTKYMNEFTTQDNTQREKKRMKRKKKVQLRGK